MASGRIVPAQSSFGAPKQKPKRFLIVLQYFAGDRDQTEELANLIADLERTRNHDADILLFRRGDCIELGAAVQAKLASKFDRVINQACRRSDAKGYPFGANQMYCDLMMLMAQIPPFSTEYFAFINLEADCVPTRPGWIGELIAAFRAAERNGKGAVGHIHDNPVNHLNGVAVYAADFFKRVNSRQFMGANPQVAYDIYFANFVRPHAESTPLIHFNYRQETITADELFAPRKNGVVPALYHGVKDGSALYAVRARHVSFTDVPRVAEPLPITPESLMELSHAKADVGAKWTPTDAELERMKQDDNEIRDKLLELSGVKVAPPPVETAKRENVYVYNHPKRGPKNQEDLALLAVWKKAWTTRGWNPVVLTLRDAAGHPRFEDFQAAIERLPFVGDRRDKEDCFNRWLALEMAGGGLLVDMDVVPASFTPADAAGDAMLLSDCTTGSINAAVLRAGAVEKFVAAIEKYDARPEDTFGKRPHVSDLTVWSATMPDIFAFVAADYGSAESSVSKLVRFSTDAVGTERKSVLIEQFLGE